ncbi:MAG: hypothetical protein ACOCXM_00590 [Myxococcota bacterium]
MEDPIELAWGRVEAQWSDPEAHSAFLALCMELDRLPEAGRRYREVRERDPERSEEAQRRIDELLSLAAQRLQLQRTPPRVDRGRRRLFWLALGVSLCLLLVALWTMVGLR